GDALVFHGQADLIANGHGFSDPFGFVYGRDIPSASHPPLYPLAMSVVALLGGTGELPQRACGALFGFGTIVLIGLIARRLAWPVAARAQARRLLLAGASTVACLLVISPWVVRNAATFHEFTLSHNDATLLAGANCHRTYHGIDLGGWNLYCISKRATPDEGKQSARWRREGLRYTGRHVGRLAVVIPVRVMRTWDFWQPKRQVMFAESQARWATKDGVAAYYVLLPLAIAGGWMIRRRRPELLVMLAPVALVTIVSAIGYGVPRFRHPADISIVVLAAVTLDRAPGLLRRLRRGPERTA